MTWEHPGANLIAHINVIKFPKYSKVDVVAFVGL